MRDVPGQQTVPIPCVSCAAPRLPYSPGHGHGPRVLRNNADDVGDGVDYSAAVSGLLSSATGSFDSISPGTTETGLKDGGGPEVPNVTDPEKRRLTMRSVTWC